jgi:hypothetical protein
MFENKVLRGIFGPKEDELRGARRNTHSEEIYNVYSSPSVIRVIKPKSMT